jgi:hypothetical protein
VFVFVAAPTRGLSRMVAAPVEHMHAAASSVHTALVNEGASVDTTFAVWVVRCPRVGLRGRDKWWQTTLLGRAVAPCVVVLGTGTGTHVLQLCDGCINY